MKLKTLIADDEPLARERLRFLLSADKEVEIVSECRNGREVVAAVRDQPVDVLFLDIQMPSSSGFDVIEEIGAAQMPVTVFVTAHNHFALKAFEAQALDYLTKPIEPERLQGTLVRVKERIASKSALIAHEQLKTILEGLRGVAQPEKTYPRRLLVRNGPKDVVVPLEDVDWIEAADYYSCLHVGAKNYMLREPIKQLAATLDPARFVRVHRSAIVNIGQVREIVREGRSEGAVVLQNGQRLRMSKVGWHTLLAATRT
ncbi:MAG TPA: LytTR family DNA-binding domain-containing protein [Terracidiphilus sp.]|jgi:two-component system LytT family response regulator|nr:LytTR family DNA-binding domain-containing protein [Terracidiphilus sp.]